MYRSYERDDIWKREIAKGTLYIFIYSGVRTTRTTSIVTLLLSPPTNRITSSITPSETRTAAASSSRDPRSFRVRFASRKAAWSEERHQEVEKQHQVKDWSAQSRAANWIEASSSSRTRSSTCFSCCFSSSSHTHGRCYQNGGIKVSRQNLYSS